MPVIAVVNEDGRTARMTTERLAEVADQGWRAVDPSQVIDASSDDHIDRILGEVGDDPIKAAAALELERAGKNRKTLVAKLTAIANS